MPVNNAQSLPDASGHSTMGLLILIALACWCWFGHGPRFPRWPLVVLIILITSGHWLGGIAAVYLGMFAGPLLTLFFVWLGLWLMVRGLGWRPRRRYHHDYHHERRGWHGARW